MGAQFQVPWKALALLVECMSVLGLWVRWFTGLLLACGGCCCEACWGRVGGCGGGGMQSGLVLTEFFHGALQLGWFTLHCRLWVQYQVLMFANSKLLGLSKLDTWLNSRGSLLLCSVLLCFL